MNYIIFHSAFWIAAKTCDGVVHCIEGEDEADETCKGQLDFPEEATIICYENRPSLDYNITIRAVPCNNITECRDGSDENGCKENELILLGNVLLVLIIVTNGLYLYMKWVYLDWSHKIIPKKSTIDEWNPKKCLMYKGNDLAHLKVITFQLYYKVIKYLLLTKMLFQNSVSQTRCSELLSNNGLFSRIKTWLRK